MKPRHERGFLFGLVEITRDSSASAELCANRVSEICYFRRGSCPLLFDLNSLFLFLPEVFGDGIALSWMEGASGTRPMKPNQNSKV
jgi:hypothetical protein